MKNFVLGFMVTAGHVPFYRKEEEIVVSFKNADWEIFQREKFKEKNGNVLLPPEWTATFHAGSSDAIFLSKNDDRRLITIRPPVGKKIAWEVLDCCR